MRMCPRSGQIFYGETRLKSFTLKSNHVLHSCKIFMKINNYLEKRQRQNMHKTLLLLKTSFLQFHGKNFTVINLTCCCIYKYYFPRRLMWLVTWRSQIFSHIFSSVKRKKTILIATWLINLKYCVMHWQKTW